MFWNMSGLRAPDVVRMSGLRTLDVVRMSDSGPLTL